MVQPNELKVGNRFIRELRNERGLEYDHDFILTEENMGKLFGDNIGLALQDLFPVPLTPAILEKCGFEFKDMMFANKPMRYWRKDWFCLNLFDKSDKYVLYLWNEKETEKSVYISSLHQLQNLYFALTGEELTINL